MLNSDDDTSLKRQSVGQVGSCDLYFQDSLDFDDYQLKQ